MDLAMIIRCSLQLLMQYVLFNMWCTKVRAFQDAGKVGLLLPTWPKAAMLAIICLSILSSCLLLTTTTAVVADISGGERKPLMGFAREQATQVTEDEISAMTADAPAGLDEEMDI
jgi:hypothetical protein